MILKIINLGSILLIYSQIKNTIQMYFFTLVLLILFGKYLKYVEFSGLGLGFYHLVILASFFLKIFNNQSLRINFSNKFFLKSPVNLLFLFLLLLFGQFIFNDNFNIKYLFIYLSGCLLMYAVYYLLQLDNTNIYKLYNIFFIFSVFSSFLLILQTKFNLGIFFHQLFSSIGLAEGGLKHSNDLLFSRGIGMSITVTDFASHNFLAFFFGILNLKKVNGLTKVIWFFGILFLSYAIYINNSSAAHLAILLSLLYYYSKKFNMVITLIILFFILSFIPNLINYINQVSLGGKEFYSESIISRIYMWAKSLQLFSQYPIFGAGFGGHLDKISAVDPFFFVNYEYGSLTIHSWFFDILSASGIIGILIFSSFLFQVFKLSRILVLYDNQLFKVLELTFISYIIFGLFSNLHYMTYNIFFITGVIIFYSKQVVSIEKNKNPILY